MGLKDIYDNLRASVGRVPHDLIAIYNHLRHELNHYASKRLGSEADADDALGATLLDLSKFADSEQFFDSKHAEEYIWKVHRLNVLDLLQKRIRESKRQTPLSDEASAGLVSPFQTPDEFLLAKEEFQRLTRAIEELPQDLREILRSHLQGESIRVSAERLGISCAALAKRRLRAIRKLGSVLGEEA